MTPGTLSSVAGGRPADRGRREAYLLAPVAVRGAGPEKVIWGTDSPFVDYEGEFRKMTRVSDAREAYELVVGGNVARLLGIAA